MTNDKNNGGKSVRVTDAPKNGNNVNRGSNNNRDGSRKDGDTKTVIRSIHVQELKEMCITELIKYAQKLGIPDVGSLRKQEIIFRILESQSEKKVEIYGEGILERLPDGFGFLRSPKFNYVPVRMIFMFLLFISND